MFIGMSLVVLFALTMVALPFISERLEARRLKEIEAITDAIDTALIGGVNDTYAYADEVTAETSYHYAESEQ